MNRTQKISQLILFTLFGFSSSESFADALDDFFFHKDHSHEIVLVDKSPENGFRIRILDTLSKRKTQSSWHSKLDLPLFEEMKLAPIDHKKLADLQEILAKPEFKVHRGSVVLGIEKDDNDQNRFFAHFRGVFLYTKFDSQEQTRLSSIQNVTRRDELDQLDLDLPRSPTRAPSENVKVAHSRTAVAYVLGGALERLRYSFGLKSQTSALSLLDPKKRDSYDSCTSSELPNAKVHAGAIESQDGPVRKKNTPHSEN